MAATVTPDLRHERTTDSLKVTHMAADEALDLIALMLAMTTRAKRERDPLTWMRNELLDMRAVVTKAQDAT